MRPDAVSLVFKFLAGVATLVAIGGTLIAMSSTDPRGIGTAFGSVLWLGIAGICYGVGVITRPAVGKGETPTDMPKSKLTPEQAAKLIGAKKKPKQDFPNTYKLD
jgi:hypothetical protein